MTIPSPQDPCWPRLIGGQVSGFKTQHAALNFLLKRLQDDSLPLPERVRRLHEFFAKYERLLARELEQIKK